MEWLKKLRAPKVYRYFYYHQYMLSAKLKDIQPAFSATLVISLTIIFQVVFLLTALGQLFDFNLGLYFDDLNPLQIILFMAVFGLISYFLFYYDNKWKDIIEEFSLKTNNGKSLGRFHLIIYLIASIFILFRLTLWLVTQNNPNYY